MMRFATLSTAGAFLVVIFSMSMWPSNARFGAPDVAKAQDNPAESKPAQIPVELSAATLRNMEIEQKLTQLSTFQYDEVPWQDIEEELERQFGLNILLDQTAIDDSLTADEPNSINLRNIPFEQGLSLMLLKKNAAFLVDDGIIRIISRDETDDPVFMRVKTYDCRNIIFNLDPSKSAQTIDKDKKTIVSKEDLLLDLIYSMTTNGAWTQTGGCASARIVNDILIVQHTREGHKAIETLLQDLNYRIKGFGIDGALSGSGQIEKQAKLIATATSSNEAASKDIFGDSENPTDSSDPFAEIENSDSASDDPF